MCVNLLLNGIQLKGGDESQYDTVYSVVYWEYPIVFLDILAVH